jgi:8-oxo-dGTP pyrophosphatase MutT (NUDIX family)
MLSDAASDDLVTMDAWEPERPSASKSAFARGFVCRHVQDSANPRASPGGKTDLADFDWARTLIREAAEESQVTVARDSIAYHGHQIVTGDPRASGPYAQVRLFGAIEALGSPAADSDGGHVYRRLMTSIPRAAELLAWGLAGDLQAQAATRAGLRFGLPMNAPAADGYV